MNSTNNYSKSKLTVEKIMTGTFSHQLVCLCHTINCPQEKAYIYKKVNFYKFKGYVISTLKVNDWNDWYFANRFASSFLTVLADYINSSENRTLIYNSGIDILTELDRMIASAKQTNNAMRLWLATH